MRKRLLLSLLAGLLFATSSSAHNEPSRYNISQWGMNAVAVPANNACVRFYGSSTIGCGNLGFHGWAFHFDAAPTVEEIYCYVDAADITDADIDTDDVEFGYFPDGGGLTPATDLVTVGTLTLLDATPADSNIHLFSDPVNVTIADTAGTFVVVSHTEVDANANTSWDFICGIVIRDNSRR